jgi:thioredoxin 1
MEIVQEVTDATFMTEVIGSNKLTIVDFWAPWCMPCRIMAPIMEEIAKNYIGKVKVCKLNTDQNPKIATEYQIMSIPSLIFFKGGQEVIRSIGVRPASELQAQLDYVLRGDVVT